MNALGRARYSLSLDRPGTLPPAEHGRQAFESILQKVERFDDDLRLIADVADQHLDTSVEARSFEFELDGKEVLAFAIRLVAHDALHAVELHAPLCGWDRDLVIVGHGVLLLLVVSASQDLEPRDPTGRGDRATSRGRRPERHAASEVKAAEAQAIVRRAIGDAAGLTIKAQLRQATVHLGYGADAWRVREALYGRAGAWSSAALDDFRQRLAAWRDRERAQVVPSALASRLEAVRTGLAELQRRFAELEAEVEQTLQQSDLAD